MTHPPTFGAWLKQQRRLLDLTQAALAAQAGCALSTLRKIEAGMLRPSQQVAERLAAALQIPAAERAAVIRFARTGSSVMPGSAPSLAMPPPLPLPPGALFGRATELEALLADPAARLITLTGMGGVGKTRLALEAAQVVSQQMPVYLVDLSSLHDAALVVPTIARTLGLALPDEPQPEALGNALAGRTLLVLLDNCEQVLEAAPQIARLLIAAPGLRLLATSRAPLRLRMEQTLHLLPLAAPPATQLFVARAQATAHTFSLTPANTAAVQAICMRLEGLPLAIELAAAWVRLLTPEEIARHLEHSVLALLRAGPRDAPLRQQTLHATIAWSYRLLPARAQTLFAQLAVFAGGWSLQAAEALGVPNVLDNLALLSDFGLVRSVAQAGETRYSLSQPIREYAQERLAAAGDWEQVQQGHLAFFLALAEEAAGALAGSRQANWLDRLEREHDNLRTALAFALRYQPEAALRLGVALHEFWNTRGYRSEGRRWLEQAIATVSAEPELQHVTRYLAGACYAAGVLAQTQEDDTRAAVLFEQALVEARQAGEQQLVAALIDRMGDLALDRNDLATAEALFAEGLALARALSNTVLEARLLHNSGYAALEAGQHNRATQHFAASLAVYRSLGDQRGAARVLRALAEIAQLQGNHTEARALLDESLAVSRALGDQGNIAWVVYLLGRLALHEGATGVALPLFVESLALNQRLGFRQGVALALLGLAATSAIQGKPKQAVRLLGASDVLLAQVGVGLPPLERVTHEQQIAVLRATLGNETFDAVYTTGAHEAAQIVAAIIYNDGQTA